MSSKSRRHLVADIAEQLARKPLIGDEYKCGPDIAPILRYFQRDDLNEGFDWCAAFVYHCCLEAGIDLPIKYPDPVPCRFAGVQAWLVWGQLPETNFYHPATDFTFTPERGDLIIYDNLLGAGPHDHIGIVLSVYWDKVITAEGNVNNRSGIFVRDRTQGVNGFVRISDSYLSSHVENFPQ